MELQEFHVTGMNYRIRPATVQDAESLAQVRLQIDGETENLDRERGEAYIDEAGFRQLIEADGKSERQLFLVAEVDGIIAGFSRCQGNELARTKHQVEFGVGVLKQYWGSGIGQNLLKQSVQWADAAGLKKITLKVLATNDSAIRLYKKHGFEVEGLLKQDKLLSDGNYYDTLLMGRIL